MRTNAADLHAGAGQGAQGALGAGAGGLGLVAAGGAQLDVQGVDAQLLRGGGRVGVRRCGWVEGGRGCEAARLMACKWGVARQSWHLRGTGRRGVIA